MIISFINIINLFKIGVQTYLIANNDQLTKITKYLYNVKKDVTHPESVPKMHHTLAIPACHIATSQLATIIVCLWKQKVRKHYYNFHY